MSYADNLVNFM